jgi:hypothetical protein
MKCLVTDQGTAAAETFLCEECFKLEENLCYAREMASQADDIDPQSTFVDCSENDAAGCCICGDDIYSEGEK